MLSDKGYFRGSTVLVSGTAGTGKTSIAAQFVEAACKRKERVLFFTFEESPSQLMRNMHSIGINLEPWLKKGLLLFHATRPTHYGLETHLSTSLKMINNFNPDVVIFDPINAFVMGKNQDEVKTMLLHLVDFMKMKQITAFFTSLTSAADIIELTDVSISSLIDTWLLLRDIEIGGERNRGLYVLKSRGMAHSNQIREFKLTDHGIELLDVYVGKEGVLTGSARLFRELEDNAEQLLRQQEIMHKQLKLDHKRKLVEAQIAQLQSELEIEESEALKSIENDKAINEHLKQDLKMMAKSRKADTTLKKPAQPRRKKYLEEAKHENQSS